MSHPFGDALQALVSKLRELLLEGRHFLQGLPGAALAAAVESLFYSRNHNKRRHIQEVEANIRTEMRRCACTSIWRDVRHDV